MQRRSSKSSLLELVEGIKESLDFVVDVLHQLLDLPLRVQQLDALNRTGKALKILKVSHS
jgi:hypothetical protein